MPVYYFDVRDGKSQYHDTYGTDLLDHASARNEAISLLPSIMRDRLPDGDRQVFTVTVRDAVGASVFTAELDFSARWSDERPAQYAIH